MAFTECGARGTCCEVPLVPVGSFDLAALVLDLAKQPGVLDANTTGSRRFSKLDTSGRNSPDFSPHHQPPMIRSSRNKGTAGWRESRSAPAFGACAERKRALQDIGDLDRFTAPRRSTYTSSPRRGGLARSALMSSSSI